MTTKKDHHTEVVRWIMNIAREMPWMLTLTFSEDVTAEQADEAARAFITRASNQIAGNKARRGHWRLKARIFKEIQPQSRRWHLHAFVQWEPTEFRERINKRGGYRKILADAWSGMALTGRIDQVGGNGEWMKLVDDNAKGYPVKCNNLDYLKAELIADL